VWEARVREAAERLAFHLHYQPVMSLRDGRPVAFEALLRWDSEVGRVPPARFVAILEDTGLIVPVGRSVLEGACQQARRWQDEHPGSTDWVVAVNVSPRQLTEPGFGYSVKEALAVAGLRPDRLCLEITGSSALLDPAAVWGELRQLKVLGTRIAIDDFGTIHSSLSQLKSFPVDALKIDGSFVAGIGQGAEDEAIVAAIINLAHALGIETVAEGVETPEQLAFLRQLGCDSAQGYLFGRPGPPEALTGFFEAGTAEQLLVPTVLKRPDQRHAVA
jgi:EAL domain-containing protein (putative c-di-GMP-specific phosphodiesterase class I)